MKNRFAFWLKDEVKNRELGLWTTTSGLTIEEILSRLKILHKVLSTRWTIYVKQTKNNAPAKYDTAVKAIKAICQRIKEEDKKSKKVLLLPAESSWNKQSEHRKQLEQ